MNRTDCIFTSLTSVFTISMFTGIFLSNFSNDQNVREIGSNMFVTSLGCFGIFATLYFCYDYCPPCNFNINLLGNNDLDHVEEM